MCHESILRLGVVQNSQMRRIGNVKASGTDYQVEGHFVSVDGQQSALCERSDLVLDNCHV